MLHVWKLTFLLPPVSQLVYENTQFACAKTVIVDNSFADELRCRKIHLNSLIYPHICFLTPLNKGPKNSRYWSDQWYVLYMRQTSVIHQSKWITLFKVICPLDYNLTFIWECEPGTWAMTGWLRKVNGVSSCLSRGCAENWYCSFCLACVLISPSPFLALNHSSYGTTNTIEN